MPGVLYKKRSSGTVYPPDWSQIGYSDTPDSTIRGFDYALDILENWDISEVVHTEEYRYNYNLMYFPANINPVNLETIDRMFQGSNLEYIDIDLTYTRTAQSLFADCHNLRSARVYNAGVNANLVSLNNMFIECHSLVGIIFDDQHLQPNTYMQNFCKNCYELPSFSYGFLNPQDRVVNASGAFENCYKMQLLNFIDGICKNIGCYSIGRDTPAGCQCNINIGANTTGVEFSFDGAAKIAGTSTISLNNVSTAQNGFRGSTIKSGASISVLGSAVNCTAMFKNASIEANVTLTVDEVSNALQMFDGLTLSGTNTTLDLSDIDFGTCANFKNTFSSMTHCNNIVFPSGYIFGSATDLQDCFASTAGLTDTCVNNILDQLAHASAYSGTKTLAHLGFTAANYPAATIQSLSNYTAFTAAGWAIGY